MQRLFLHKVIIIAILAVIVLLPLNGGLQNSWAAIPRSTVKGSLLDLDLRVFVAGKPINLILVEKDKQRLRVLEHDGRLRVLTEYQAVTGENPGQKEKEGDSRTPEGIYFITKIYTDSEITIFGKRAFHLDYPNVFDLGEGKGGHGIFIHGTNKELIANSTNGCVTLNNVDLEQLVKFLPIGTVPVIVVSSLSDLKQVEIGDDRVGLFAANDFQVPKALFLSGKHDLLRVFFESLYLISVNNQMVAVGEYQSYSNPNVVDRGLIRGYLDYSSERGWAILESVWQDPRPLPSWADSNLLNKNPLSVSDTATSIDLADAKELFWQGKDDRYLSWYLETRRTNLGVEVLPQKSKSDSELPLFAKENLAVQMEERQGLEFFWLFMLTVGMSIGSVWIIMKLRFKSDDMENAALDYIEKEKHLATVSRINSDISWIREMLPDLYSTVAKTDQQNKDSEFNKKLDTLERQLKVKQAELSDLLSKIASLQNQEESNNYLHKKELENINTKLSETISELDDKRHQCQELTEKSERMDAVEEELQKTSKRYKELENQTALLSQLEEGLGKNQLDLEQLTSENFKLQEMIDQKGDYEELAKLQGHLEVVEADLTRTTQHLAESKKKNALMKKLKIELQESRSDLELLTSENFRLKKLADKEEDKKELVSLQAHLEVVEKDLGKASAHRAELEVKVEGLVNAEKELKERQDDIEQLSVENENLKHTVKQKENKQLVHLRSHLEGVEAELKDAQEHRIILEEQVLGLTKSEDELRSRKEKIDELVEDNAQIKDDAESEEREDVPTETEMAESKATIEAVRDDFVVDTKDANYLPNDVLMKWIGK